MKRTIEDSNSSEQPYRRLPKGIILLKNYLSVDEQRTLMLKAFELGSHAERSSAGFYMCDNEKTRHMKMMNCGLKCEGGGKHEIDIPPEWKALALKIAHAAHEQEISLPLFNPNICVVNLYTVNSKLSYHQDVVTKSNPAKPIVSISIGLSADFCLKKDYGKNHKEHKVPLRLISFLFHQVLFRPFFFF
jgi:alkylated DNA repair dioxygenase AlkB